jgi:processive 1,2-diacylglycerol beta-glucosyltransferase
MQPLTQARISPNHITIIGAALKLNFFEPKNIDLLKKEYLVPLNKPIIMIMMGAQGSSELQRYAHHLLHTKHPIHLLLCIGKNYDSKTALEQLIVPKHITTSIIEYTEHIADLMAISDILISKSGSLSVCEALYTNTPLVLDATSTILPWEKFNHVFIKTHQLGTSITNHKNINPVVSQLISNPKMLTMYKSNLKNITKLDTKTHIKSCLNAL